MNSIEIIWSVDSLHQLQLKKEKKERERHYYKD